MKRLSYLDRILDYLNQDHNRSTEPRFNFELLEEVASIAKFAVGQDIIGNYGIDYGSDEFFYLIESWIRNNYGNGEEALPGDTIVIREMPDDPNPIPEGTKGYVINVNSLFPYREDHLIVKWENDSKLNVIKGIDTYDVIMNTDDNRAYLEAIFK